MYRCKCKNMKEPWFAKRSKLNLWLLECWPKKSSGHSVRQSDNIFLIWRCLQQQRFFPLEQKCKCIPRRRPLLFTIYSYQELLPENMSDRKLATFHNSNPAIDKLAVLQKRWSTDFEALNVLNIKSGSSPAISNIVLPSPLSTYAAGEKGN